MHFDSKDAMLEGDHAAAQRDMLMMDGYDSSSLNTEVVQEKEL